MKVDEYIKVKVLVAVYLFLSLILSPLYIIFYLKFNLFPLFQLISGFFIIYAASVIIVEFITTRIFIVLLKGMLIRKKVMLSINVIFICMFLISFYLWIDSLLTVDNNYSTSAFILPLFVLTFINQRIIITKYFFIRGFQIVPFVNLYTLSLKIDKDYGSITLKKYNGKTITIKNNKVYINELYHLLRDRQMNAIY